MSLPVSRPTPVARYNTPAIVLHWLVAAVIIITIVAGLSAARADDSDVRRLVDLHKSLGLTAFGLVILRVLWRLAHKPPPLPDTYSPLERIGAHGAHGILYALMVLLPLTGYIHDSAWSLAATHPIVLYGLVHFPRIGFIEALDPAIKDKVHAIFSAAHVYLGYALYGLLALHLLGVAKHHALDHEAELQRMLPAPYERPDPEDKT
jgi:cytochrome b561